MRPESLCMAIAAVAIIPSLNLLVVDDEPCVRQLCAEVAVQVGMKATVVATAQEAMDVLENSNVDILITDLTLSESNGFDLINQVHSLYGEVAVIALSGCGRIDTATPGATRLGAVDYVTKPFHVAELRSRLERAAIRVDLQNAGTGFCGSKVRTNSGFGGLMVASHPKNADPCTRLLHKVSQHECPVLILRRNPAPGKRDDSARSIHYSSPRKRGRFSPPVDCSSLVPTLIATELFWIRKRAALSLTRCNQKCGLLEAASGGTLFLDEIGDIPVALQSKLLRALQERGSKARRLDGAKKDQRAYHCGD